MILATTGNMLTFLSTTPQLATPNSPLQMKTSIDQSMTRYQASLDQVEMEIFLAEKYLQLQLKACQAKLKEEEEAAAASKAEAEAKLRMEELQKAQRAAFPQDPVLSPDSQRLPTPGKIDMTSPSVPRTLGNASGDSDILGLFEDSIMDLEGNPLPANNGTSPLDKDDDPLFMSSPDHNVSDPVNGGVGSADTKVGNMFSEGKEVIDIDSVAGHTIDDSSEQVPMESADNLDMNMILGSMDNGDEQQVGSFNDDMDDLFNGADFYMMPDNQI